MKQEKYRNLLLEGLAAREEARLAPLKAAQRKAAAINPEPEDAVDNTIRAHPWLHRGRLQPT